MLDDLMVEFMNTISEVNLPLVQKPQSLTLKTSIPTK
jgi:hypothetical protein